MDRLTNNPMRIPPVFVVWNASNSESTWSDNGGSWLARRTGDWTPEAAPELQKPEVARGFLVSAIAGGEPLRVAFAKAVRAIGVKKFTAKVHMAPPNLQRAIDLRTTHASRRSSGC